MADFERKLQWLSERGSPVGAEELIERIEAELAGDPFVVVTKQRGGLLMTKTDEPMTTYPGRRRRFGPAVAALVVIVATAGLYLAMAGNGDQPLVDQGPVAPATSAAAPTTTPPSTSTTAAADAAPPELAGRWVTEVNGEQVQLSFTGTNYAWQFVGGQLAPGGKISVEGNRIRFYNAPNPGDGFYEWTIDGDTLTFTELEPADVVSERQGQLTNFTFRRP